VIVAGNLKVLFMYCVIIVQEYFTISKTLFKCVYRALVGKPEGKIPLGRPWRRWEDIIKADLQEVGCGGYGKD
jgi:hypothetical protein